MGHPVHAGIHISGPDGFAVREYADTLRMLLSAPCGDQAKAEAMITMRTMCKLENVHVSNCSINMTAPRAEPPQACDSEPPSYPSTMSTPVIVDAVSDAIGIPRAAGRKLARRGAAKVKRASKSSRKR